MHSAVVDYEALNVIVRYESQCCANWKIVSANLEFTSWSGLTGLEYELDIKGGDTF